MLFGWWDFGLVEEKNDLSLALKLMMGYLI